MAATRKNITFYTSLEREALLTGSTCSPGSTRFGHRRRVGLDIDAMRTAWQQIGDELMDQWNNDPRYQHDRKKYGDPFVVRLLAGTEGAVL